MPATSLSFTPPVSTISASELARDKSRFELWAVAVNLNLHEKGLPKELRDLEETSLIFPTWLKADENTRSFPGFETLITELREATSGAPDLKYQDNDTNSDLHRALPSILETCHHLRMLCEDQYGLHYNEADFRWSIDHLMHFVWKFLGKGMMKIFLERVLALPTASGVPFSCATSTADSVTCINLGMKPLEAITYDIKCIYSCSPGPTNSLLLPHCIIQFKAPGIAGNVPERQVLFGMVSALHQRRALGFSEQFVFGISHEEASTVHVYAARWEHLRADPQAERSLQPSGPLNPSADASQHPVNNKNTQSLNARQEIRKYLFTSFDLRKPDEAVRFSLLMGATMSLAKNYKDAISLRNTQAPSEGTSSKRQRSGQGPNDGVLPVEFHCYASSSSDGLSVAEPDQDDELPTGLGLGTSLSHKYISELVEIDPVQKCEEWVSSRGELKLQTVAETDSLE